MSSGFSKTEENRPATPPERTEEDTLDILPRKLPYSWPPGPPAASKQKELRGRLRGLISRNRAPLSDKNVVSSTMICPKINILSPSWSPPDGPISMQLRHSYGDFNGKDSFTRNQWNQALTLINWFEHWDRVHPVSKWNWERLEKGLDIIETITGDLKTSWGDLDTTIKTQKTVGRHLSKQIRERRCGAGVGTSFFESISEYKDVLGLVAAHAIQGLNLNPRDAPNEEARMKVEDFLHHRLGPKSKQLSLQGVNGLLTAAMDNLWKALNHAPESVQPAQPTPVIDEHA